MVDLTDQVWRRVREAIDGYAATLLRFVGESYGKDAVHQAWLEFTIGARDEFVEGHPNTELFFSWLFHKWTPGTDKGNEIEDTTLYGVPPTRAYLARRSSRLNPLLQRYLQACLDAPFGFHEILDCKPGIGFATRDVLTGAEFVVRERSASATLTNGDIIFGLIVPVQGIAMMEAVSPFSFPPIFKTHLIHVRQRDELREHPDLALRSLYFTLAQSYLHPSPPELHNTDGELLEPRTLYFDIESAQSAFDALASLALGTPRDELLRDAKFDVNGAVIEAQIPWIKRNDPKRSGLETVLMGRIRIQDRKLTAEVNSAGRAKALRTLLEKTPGLKARYKRTRKQSLEGVMPPMSAGAGVTLAPRNAEEIELMQQPEVLAQIEQIQRHHYETWPEIPLPALNGRTPLEAVKDSDGREMVDALITQFERDATRMPVPVDAKTFAALRRRLGLSPTSQS